MARFIGRRLIFYYNKWFLNEYQEEIKHLQFILYGMPKIHC